MIEAESVLYPEIEKVLHALDPEAVSAERRATLQPLIDYIRFKTGAAEEVRLNFICTHNSRRSHLSQVWAQAISCFLGVENITCYSGGTEATALFPATAATLKDQGFKIRKLTENANPVYAIKFSENRHPVIGFSKRMDDDFNPKSHFAAIMTCDAANEACPFVPGAERRIPVTYEDPKAFDNTPQQAEQYRERSLEIATEFKYVFPQIT